MKNLLLVLSFALATICTLPALASSYDDGECAQYNDDIGTCASRYNCRILSVGSCTAKPNYRLVVRGKVVEETFNESTQQLCARRTSKDMCGNNICEWQGGQTLCVGK